MDRAAELYRGESGREYHELKRALPERALPWVMSLRAAKFQPHILPSDTVFEFGAGSGWNLGRLNCARKLGYDAADFLRDRIVAAGAEFITDTASIPDSTVDVVICHHTLEHLLNPSECLAEMQRVLKDDGRLILYVPWERERRYRVYRESEPNHHLYTWNAQNLGNLVVANGYRIELVRVLRYGYDRLAASIAVKLRLGESGFRLMHTVLVSLRPLVEVELVAKRDAKAPQNAQKAPSKMH